MPRTDWLDRSLYPFQSHYLELEEGRMHYLDEGTGPTIVMVHGTPTWSFLYRRLIQDLSRDHRVIAMDHLGFGLSDKPEGWGYRPEDHAQNLERLLTHLDPGEITLIAHDFGGPIGLDYAIRHHEDLRGLVLFNTWCWSLRGTPAERVSRVMGGPIGRLLYRRLNLSPRILLRAAFADKDKLTKELHRHYTGPFPDPGSRLAPWILAHELIGSSGWYEELWQGRDRLAGKPTLLLWGTRDPTFGPDALERWKGALPNAHVVEFPEAGHFVQEEAPEEAIREVRAFLGEANVE